MYRNLAVVCVALALAVGCGDEETTGTCEVEPGDTWNAPDWETNTQTARALRAQLDALAVELMRAAEEGTEEVEGVDTLAALYAAGDPSIQSITTEYYDAVMESAFAEFVELIAAGPQDLVDDEGAWAPGEAGGIFGSSARGINEGGLEIRQLVDKGLFGGAALYNYGLSLTEGEITPATVEALAALWGANADLDAEGEITDSAVYSYRMGYFARIRAALVAAHAYAADEGCGAERDEAVVEFFRAWEEALLARFVFYTNSGASAISSAAGDDEIASGLHAIAEGVGLALGFRSLPNPAQGPLANGARLLSDSAIDEIMDVLGVVPHDLGASTLGDLVTHRDMLTPAVLEIEAITAEALGLELEEVEAWRRPSEG